MCVCVCGGGLIIWPGSESILLHILQDFAKVVPYRVQVVGAVLFPVRLLCRPLRFRLQEPLLQHQCLLNILLANSVERLIEPRYAITLTSPVILDSTSKSVNNGLPLWWQHVSHTHKTTTTCSSHSGPCSRYHSRSKETLAWGGGSGDGLARNESTIHAAAPSPAPGIHDACLTDAHAEWVCQFEEYDKKGSIGNNSHAHGVFTRRPHRYRTHTPTQIHMFHVRVLKNRHYWPQSMCNTAPTASITQQVVAVLPTQTEHACLHVGQVLC